MIEEEIGVDRPEILTLLESRKYDPTGEQIELDWNITRVDDAGVEHNIAMEGELIMVKAQPGAHKSSFVRGVTSGLYNEANSLGFKFKHKGGLIICDYEQSKAIWQSCMRSFYKLANLNPEDDTSNKFASYIFTPDTNEEKRLYTDMVIEMMDGVKYLVIDQLAAMCANYNDPVEAQILASMMKTWAFENGITIFIVMHTNFGTGGKANGAVGSEVEKACGVTFWLQKEGKKTKVHNSKIRETALIDDFWIYNGLEGHVELYTMATPF